MVEGEGCQLPPAAPLTLIDLARNGSHCVTDALSVAPLMSSVFFERENKRKHQTKMAELP